MAKNHEDFWRKSFNLGFAFIFVLVGFAIIWPVVGPNSFIENGNSDGSPIPKSREQTATPEIETVGEIENKESSPIDGVGRYVEADDPSESFSSDVAIENQPDAAPGEITTNAQVGVEQTSQSEENEVQKPQSNRERKLLTVRVYAGKIEGEKVQRVMNDLGVTVEPRNRDVCLSGTPITSIWPDKSVAFSEFKEIFLLLIDSGFKFYVVHPKFQSAPNVIDLGSIVRSDTCTLQFDYSPFTREEVLSSQYFCAGYRPLQSPPEGKDSSWINEYCFTRFD